MIGFCFLPASAQKKTLTLKDAVLKQWHTLYPKRMQQLSWRKGTAQYTFAKDNSLMAGTSAGKADQMLVALDDLKKSHEELKDLSRLPGISWKTADTFRFSAGSRIFEYSVKSKQSKILAQWEKGAENQELDPATNTMAYTKENNLFVNKGGTEYAVSSEANPAIVYGKVVHRNEFGVHKGIYWAPKGGLLAFYRNDQTAVTDYPLLNIFQRPAKAREIKYPMAGMSNEKVTVGIFDLSKKKTVYLQTGNEDQYLTNIAWAPDGKTVYVVILNRGQNHIWVNAYNPVTGEFIKTLFEETADKYVQPLHPMAFIPNRPNEFLWRSERDGYTHLYRYNTEGKLLNQVTKGEWVVTDFIGFDKKSRKAIVQGTANNGLDRQIYAADLKTGKLKKVTSESGTYGVQYNKKTGEYISVFSANGIPHRTQVLSAKGAVKKDLLISENPLKDYKVSPIELGTIKAADGTTDLNTRLIKPANFDASKKYPVLVYVYAGPGVQLIKNQWNAGISLWMQYMAQKGYIIFTVDSRGTENRGRDFEQATFRQLGTLEAADQLAGVNYLKSLPYVDKNRMAVHGWSYGGFMTTSLMVKSPETFKVGVAGGPVIDWSYYEIMYTERFMDTPQTNPEGYAESRLQDKAKNLKGKLLMIHGLDDDVVVVQHSLMFIKNCVDNGTPIDYFVYPGHKHNVRGKDRLHLMQKVLNYVEEKLD
ncbi:MAG: S9 family peptidase [Cytophagales bacterium]|nr:S9 family peptidase [Cytophagales bacterium]